MGELSARPDSARVAQARRGGTQDAAGSGDRDRFHGSLPVVPAGAGVDEKLLMWRPVDVILGPLIFLFPGPCE